MPTKQPPLQIPAPESLTKTPVSPERVKNFLEGVRQNFRGEDLVFQRYVSVLEAVIEHPERYPELKPELLRIVAQRAEVAWQGRVHHTSVKAWIGAIRLFTQIAGLVTDRKVEVTVTSDPLVLKFREAVSGLNEDQIAAGLRQLKAMPRELPPICGPNSVPKPEPKFLNAEFSDATS